MIGSNNPRLPISYIETEDNFIPGQAAVILLEKGGQARVLVEKAQCIGRVWHLLGLVEQVCVPEYSLDEVESYVDRHVLVIIGTHAWMRLAEEEG